MAWKGNDCRMFTGLASVQVPTAQSTTNESKTDPTPINEGGEKQEKDNLVATVTVTKVEVTKNGNTRAICRVENGKDGQIVIAKNGIGKTLQDVNKKFEIEYNVMKDGEAWFAIKAKQL